MKKNSRSIRYSGTYTSPGTPEYDHNNVGQIPKSWSSERVSLPMNSTQRHINASALMPFNYSAKTLPSKWDDAQRWITSPISGDNCVKSLVAQPQRRPKSKSGPLGPPGLVYLSNYSPVGSSPLAAGVLVPDGLSTGYNGGIGGKSDSLYGANYVARSTSGPGLCDSLGESSMPSSQDDKLEVANEDEFRVSPAVYSKDMATQMSPQRSTSISASKGRLLSSTMRSTVPVLSRPISNLVAKDDIRDVQVDKGTTTTRQPKSRGLKNMKKNKANSVEDLPLPWNASEASKSASKEEAKIMAWENLQKAEAETAIRKLEMKLEKKRSASVDRILNKLRAAQMKAEAMRKMLSENHSPRVLRTSRIGFSCCVRVDTRSLTNRYMCRLDLANGPYLGRMESGRTIFGSN